MMENSFAFTQRRIKDLPPARGRADWYHDSNTPGLAVTVSPLGKAVFYYVGRSAGRTRRVKLGNADRLSVGQARTKVKSLTGDIANGKLVGVRQRHGQHTLDDLAAYYQLHHVEAKGLRTPERRRRDYAALLKPDLGKLPLAAIRRDVVQQIITTLRKRGVGPANRAHSLLSGMFNVAVANGWAEFNPVKGIHRPRSEPRQRYLRADEVQKFMEAVAAIRSDNARDFLLLALYTGARRACVASMRWDEIEGDCWVIPASKSKSKRPMVIELTTYARTIIDARRGNGSEWVLPADLDASGGHYADPKRAIERVRELSGLRDIRLHDLRRSVGAWLLRSGESLRTVQVALGHRSVAITAAHYAPMESAQIRTARESATAIMLGGRKPQ